MGDNEYNQDSDNFNNDGIFRLSEDSFKRAQNSKYRDVNDPSQPYIPEPF